MKIQAVWQLLRQNWCPEPPVDDVGAFDNFEAVLGQDFPADYKWFVMESNGGETLAPLPRVKFYRLEELLERRDDGQPPQVLEIATNDTDGYAFDLTVNRDNARYPVVRYPLGDRVRTDLEFCAKDFADFLTTLVSGRLE